MNEPKNDAMQDAWKEKSRESYTLDFSAVKQPSYIAPEQIDWRIDQSHEGAERTFIHSKVVGSTFCAGQEHIAKLKQGDLLVLWREPENTHDINAVLVLNGRGDKLGYIRRDLASSLAPAMDSGIPYYAVVEEVTGGNPGKEYWGCNIRIERANTNTCPACKANINEGVE